MHVRPPDHAPPRAPRGGVPFRWVLALALACVALGGLAGGWLTRSSRGSPRVEPPRVGPAPEAAMAAEHARAVTQMLAAMPQFEILAPVRAAGRVVTVVEAVDFECPGCRVAALGLQPLLAARFGPTGRVRVALAPLPLPSLHPQAVGSWVAAWCAARAGRFAAYSTGLYATQGARAQMDEAAVGRHYQQVARGLGLADAPFAACRADPAVADSVRAAGRRFMALGMRSTPTFFVDGRLVADHSPAALMAEIEGALQR